MKATNKTLTFLALAGTALTSSALAQESNLWITEVLPSTGQIEVTNIGDEAFTTTRRLPFCHRFNYGTGIPSGLTFEAGESQIFTVTFANQASSDLWLYRPGGFGNSANIISGLQWGTTSGIGRTNLATTVNLWDDASAAPPAPAAGQSIQLTGDDPFSAANWTVGEPNLGTFGVEEEAPEDPEENLWITEVLPATGEIEVTNVGDVAFTTTRRLPFCHRFNYGTGIPAGVTFEVGQSRIYTTTFSNEASSDLWLYRPGGFGNAANVLNGLQWGTTAAIGRTALATSVDLWDAAAASAPAPAAGQSIQLTGDDPFSAANWTVGAPNLGSFGIEEVLGEALASINIVDGQIALTWTGGTPPYQVQTSSTLQDFTNFGPVTNATSVTIPLDSEKRFFRVQSNAELPQTARFSVTFSSLWSSLTFRETPIDPSLGDLVGATHNSELSLWAPEELATMGVQQLAQTGSTTTLSQEVGFSIGGNLADNLIVGPGVREAGVSTFEITVDRDFPLLSLVSRLSDSPDWFTGVQSLSLLDEDAAFVDDLDIMLMPWDAGVDSSTGFGAEAMATVPVDTVSSLSNDPAFEPSQFLGETEETFPVGRLQITRIIE